eukprot:NODE_8559_length_352_cov_33.762376_g6802_i0.p2 GENE.NODE_8559_length_352_cov_33.762376_g6802_i0~~NODE_8559_length_352_cov_33.762376_g6802_i0.p2  ORF type:complete len:51 (-),score=17.66 NODE_8559_length_352_cov_33.762376_g6802_i0:198-323(-)
MGIVKTLETDDAHPSDHFAVLLDTKTHKRKPEARPKAHQTG